MKRSKILLLIILSVGLLFNCDDDVPLLDFPADVVSRMYKIGNIVSGEDPADPQSVLDAFVMIEELSQGGEGDIAVITVPQWVNWDGYVIQTAIDFIDAMRAITNNNVELHFLADPLPHRIYLGGGGPYPDPPGSSFTDPAVRQGFKDYVLDAIAVTSPEYITLGVEVNMYYYGYGRADFVHLNSLINETADLIRAVAPETKILTSFQWEQLLFNLENGGWDPIENFEWNIDILGISSFPPTALKYLDPSRMPPEYYTMILDHFPPNHTPETLALAFAELGFASRPEDGCDGSEKHQSNGIAQFIQIAAQFEHLEFVNYWYLHDHDGYWKQTSYGLIESTTTQGGTPGREKLSYFMWEQLGQLPYIPDPIRK